MQCDLIDGYAVPIGALASRLAQRGALDHNSLDLDDYQSMLRVVAVETQLRFREKGVFASTNERRYVIRSLQNAVVDLARSRNRVAVGLHNLDALSMGNGVFWEDSRLEARECLRHLMASLGDEFFILLRVAQSGGRVSEAYCSADGSYETFRSKVRRLRLMAKKIMEQMSTEVQHG